MQCQDFHPKYAKLNIGGLLFYSTIDTLTKHDTMLKAMFSGRVNVFTDTEGFVFIDRCGKHFNSILNFLRDEHIALPDKTYEIAELLAEAKFYLITPLVDACQQALRLRKRVIEPQQSIHLISSNADFSQLITLSSKPIIKLLINRRNNMFSYTSASDNNLMKNIELFDKLSLRFGSRFLFIKDVSSSRGICCWCYFGSANQVAEVCCTSIVYATDKKYTKVDFPEAKIYEECLNLVLYENRAEPDQKLMQTTSRRGFVTDLSSAYGSDE